jgi:KaiC/GvpD/RAD55 family RecA-like ATPase
MAEDGEPVATGIPWLDARFRRGGLTQGRVAIVGGPPFAGKTNILVDAALQMAQRAPVFALFHDEGRTQAAVRLGVMLGVPVEDIEGNPTRASARVAELSAERSLYLISPDSEFANAEDVFDFVSSKTPAGEIAVVVLDSVQTIPARREMNGLGDKARLDEFMSITRGRTESDRRITLISSQANRAFYRSKNIDDNATAITAFTGSSSIEFLCDFGVVLALPEDETEIVRAEIVKNRLGTFRKGQRLPKVFFIRYDDDSGRMLEVDDAARESAALEAATAALAPKKLKVKDTLKDARRGDGLSAAQVIQLTHLRRSDVYASLSRLVDEKTVYAETKGRSVTYFYDRSLE